LLVWSSQKMHRIYREELVALLTSPNQLDFIYQKCELVPAFSTLELYAECVIEEIHSIDSSCGRGSLNEESGPPLFSILAEPQPSITSFSPLQKGAAKGVQLDQRS
jgi:hypothetical protein